MTRRGALAAMGSTVLAGLVGPLMAQPGAAPRLTHGFNLPGWVDRPDSLAPSEAVLEELRRAGFESVRLPVSGELIAAEDRSASIAMLDRIGQATRQLLDAQFAVVLDMHPSGPLAHLLKAEPDEAADVLARAWSLLAERAADLPATEVNAELLNEPPLERQTWLALRDRLAEAVREKCPDHTLVWGPARYQGIWELADTPPLADPNTVAAVHYYTPMGFTHQCENWDSSPLGRLANLPFPASPDNPAVTALAAKLEQAGDKEASDFLAREFSSPWTAAHIDADFASAGEWSRANGCPVILNEFGVLDFCVDPASRAYWIRAVRQAAERNGIGWTYWEVDHGFGFIADRKSTDGFDAGIVDALLGSDR